MGKVKESTPNTVQQPLVGNVHLIPLECISWYRVTCEAVTAGVARGRARGLKTYRSTEAATSLKHLLQARVSRTVSILTRIATHMNLYTSQPLALAEPGALPGYSGFVTLHSFSSVFS